MNTPYSIQEARAHGRRARRPAGLQFVMSAKEAHIPVSHDDVSEERRRAWWQERTR